MHAISPLPDWFPLTPVAGSDIREVEVKETNLLFGYGFCNTASIAEAAPYQDFEDNVMDFKAYLALQSLQSNLCRSSLYILNKSTPLANKDLGVDNVPKQTKDAPQVLLPHYIAQCTTNRVVFSTSSMPRWAAKFIPTWLCRYTFRGHQG